MDNPFDRKAGDDSIKVQVDETFYTGNEVVAYFDEILNALKKQKRSLKNKAQFCNLARILIKKRENRKASGVIHQALELYPNDNTILKLKTENFLNLRDYQSALMSVNQALETYPHDVSLMMLKARVFDKSGESRMEEKVYEDIMKLPYMDYEVSRGKLSAMRRLANLYFKQEQFDKAIQMVEQLIRRSPDEGTWAMYFTILMRQGKSEDSRRAREEFARYKRARGYFDKGSEYELQNKFNLALSNYRKGLEIYPNEPSVNMKVGSLLMYRKNWYSKAQEYIQKAVELDPDSVSYRTNLVLCMQNQGKYREAYQEAKIAEKLDPMSNIYYLRKLAVKVGKDEEFIELIREAIDQDKNNELASLRYELGLFYESRGEQEKAEEWYQKALELFREKARNFPDDWDLYMDLGNCYKRLSQYAEAEASYLTALNIPEADKEEIYENLMDLYQKSRQPEKATPYLKELVRLNPGKITRYLDLGVNFLSRLTSSLGKKDREL